jgi:hypothetical protein
MATKTATIRVTRQTRDLLAEQAQARGISLSAMLAELARSAEREAIYRAERVASRADAGDLAVSAEEHDWEAALDDGVA